MRREMEVQLGWIKARDERIQRLESAFETESNGNDNAESDHTACANPADDILDSELTETSLPVVTLSNS